MKIRDMKIRHQIGFGMGLIIVVVLVLGFVSLYFSELLWNETKGMYEHPLQVRTALGELRRDVLSSALEMRELLLATDDSHHEEIVGSIHGFDSKTDRSIDIIRNTYLGPATDVDSVRHCIDHWRNSRDETIKLIREGEWEQARDRLNANGISVTLLRKTLAALDTISEFQLARAERFYIDAQGHKNDMITGLIILVLVIVGITLVISLVLLRNIRDPLSRLVTAATDFRMGKTETRCDYSSENEFGQLTLAFNDMTDIINLETRRKNAVAAIADVMLREVKLREFSNELLSALMSATGSQSVALYLLNETGDTFTHYHSIGLVVDRLSSFSAAGREGEFGRALVTGQIQFIRKIPKDTVFALKTVSGEIIPREIITIPVMSEGKTVAIISMASVRSYSQEAGILIDDISDILSARLNGVLLFEKLEKMYSRVEAQNTELDTQRNELSQQKNELNEQNTELEIQKRRLDELLKVKDNFISRMSHELRTPLNSVLALTGVLSRRLRGTVSEEEFGYLDIITRNGKQLLGLINDILDLTRIGAGKENIRLSKFHVSRLVNDVTSVMEPQAGEKNVKLKAKVTGELPEMVSDYDKCIHILQNLVANAIKFTDEGSVSIDVKQVGEMIQISVTDTGIGIEADQIPFIFDEFRQGEEGWSRKYGGTGLGLAIVKKYAHMLKGNVTVESVPAKGSTFRLMLPVSPDLDRESSRDMAKPRRKRIINGGSPEGRGKTILLVDDSEPAIIQIREILSQDGYVVQVARNGKEALKVVAAAIPDAMVLDLMMPEMDGFEVLRMIRSAPQTNRLPVLILTARHLSAEELGFLKNNNVHQLIQKGDVSRDELLIAISEMVYP